MSLRKTKNHRFIAGKRARIQKSEHISVAPPKREQRVWVKMRRVRARERERRGEKRKKRSARPRAYEHALTLRLTENYNYEPRGAFTRYKNLKQCRGVAPLGACFAAAWLDSARLGSVRQERLLIENYRKAQLRENYFYSLAGWRCIRPPRSDRPAAEKLFFGQPFFFPPSTSRRCSAPHTTITLPAVSIRPVARGVIM